MILYCYIKDYDASFMAPFFKAIAPEADFRPWPNWGNPEDDAGTEAYAYVWAPPHGELAKYKNLKAIFSVGAGVDHLTSDPDLPRSIPVIRMADESLKDGMREYATMAALWFLRDMPKVQNQQKSGTWQQYFPRAPKDYRIGLMGYGNLGQAVVEALKPFGFKINAWSRTPKDDDRVTHYTGTDQLQEFLGKTDMVYALLPHTSETTNLLNAESLSWLPKGAAVVNAGRGNLIDLDALMQALDSGALSGAMLDVFETEPVPADHPIWQAKNVIITPHVAAITRPDTSSAFVIQSIDKLRKGEQLPTQLSFERGY